MVGPAAIEVEGLREFSNALRQIDKDLAKELQRTNKSVAQKIRARQIAAAPVKTGRLKRSIRANATQRSARTVGGGAKVPYFGVQEFGGTVPSRGNAGIGRVKRGGDSLGRLGPGGLGGRRIRIKAYRGPVGKRTPWWDDDSGYFFFPAAREAREEIVEQYADMLEALARRAFPNP